VSHKCYDRRVATVPSRDLRNRTRQVLDRVEAGEDVTITVDGRPVARVTRLAQNPTWVSREALRALLEAGAADAGLAAELDDLVPEMIDDRDIV
jgi:prevent-host-death family protein